MSRINGIFSKLYSDFIKSKIYQKSAKFSNPVELVIAVSGAAALGKTFFSENLKDFLDSHELKSTYIGLDGYLLDRQSRKEKNLSGYDPAANDFGRMIDDLNSIMFKAAEIKVPIYDHKKGECNVFEKRIPNTIIILDGIMSMHYQIRKYSNLKIFMDAEKYTLKGLRILEDRFNRGYSIVEAIKHTETEYKTYLKCIDKQKSFANIIIEVDQYYNYEYNVIKM